MWHTHPGFFQTKWGFSIVHTLICYSCHGYPSFKLTSVAPPHCQTFNISNHINHNIWWIKKYHKNSGQLETNSVICCDPPHLCWGLYSTLTDPWCLWMSGILGIASRCRRSGADTQAALLQGTYSVRWMQNSEKHRGDDLPYFSFAANHWAEVYKFIVLYIHLTGDVV